MTLDPRSNLLEAVAKVTAAIIAARLIAPDVIKRRDPREPGKRRKEEFEDALLIALARYWRRQARRIREVLTEWAPDRKAIGAPPISWFEEAFDDPEFQAGLMRVIRGMTEHGIELFATASALGLDYSIFNAPASEFARNYSYELIRNIDNTTRKALQQALQSFVEIPGFTIRDIINSMPYSEARAMNIAVTEATRVYAEANQVIGNELRQEFPEVRVIHTWWTNNMPPTTCELCLPLHGMVVEFGKPFIHPSTGVAYYKPGEPHIGCLCWDTVTTALAEL